MWLRTEPRSRVKEEGLRVVEEVWDQMARMPRDDGISTPISRHTIRQRTGESVLKDLLK